MYCFWTLDMLESTFDIYTKLHSDIFADLQNKYELFILISIFDFQIKKNFGRASCKIKT